jgi:hypothetical protein
MQTFVVRVWIPAVPDGGLPQLNGLVEHIVSGRRRSFSGGPEVLDFMTECLRERWARPFPSGEEDELPGSALGGSGSR